MDSCALSDSTKERLAIILRKKSLSLSLSGAPLFVMTASFKHFAAAALAALTLLSGAAQADEQSVRDQLMKNTGLKADSVRPAPIPGLWEVFIQDRLFYVDDKVDYVFSGSIIDTKTQTNQTQERLREWARESWNKWPREDAVKQVFGDGSREDRLLGRQLHLLPLDGAGF